MNYPQTCWFLSKPNRTEVKDETHLRSDPEPKVLRQSLDARKPPAFLLTPRPQAWLRLTAGSTAIPWVTPHHLNQAVQSHELQHTTVWVFSAHLQSITPKIQGKISWESKPLSRKIFKIRMFKIISLKNAWGFNTLPNCCKNFDTSIKMLISATKKNPGPYQLCFHENITQNW